MPNAISNDLRRQILDRVREGKTSLGEFSSTEIVHSDQGSECDSRDFIDLVENPKIKISVSRKGSP